MNILKLFTSLAHATLISDGGLVQEWSILSAKKETDLSILYQGTRVHRTGIPTLFPNYGEGDMYHGFWRNTACRLEQLSEDKGKMWIDHTMISEEAKKIYPYQFRTEVMVELGTQTDMIYTMSVANTDTRPIPIMPGLHPYWAIPHKEKKNIHTEGMQGFDASAWDWDTYPPDNVYPYHRKASFSLSDRTIVIEDMSDIPRVQHIVVWSQPLSMPDHHFVCFEPITGGDNAIKEHPILVSPSDTWVMKLKFSCILEGK